MKMENKGALAVEELLRRIEDLEYGHAHLKHEMCNLMNSRNRQTAALSSSRHCPPLRSGGAPMRGGGTTSHSDVKVTEAWYFNILQSIDDPIHITDSKGCVIYRNRAWEEFYGYSASETLGKNLIELIIESQNATIANTIIQQIFKGESHGGEFVVRNKKGERFLTFGSTKPLRDENGTVIGMIGISTHPRPYQEVTPQPSVDAPIRIASQQPLPSDLVITRKKQDSKFKSKTKRGDSQMCNEDGNGESSSMANSDYKKPRIHESARTEWMFKSRIAWLWKENERKGGTFNPRTVRFCWHWLQSDQEYVLQTCSSIPAKVESPPSANNSLVPWYRSYDKVYEIKWEDLMIMKCIGRGSYGSVYHAMWHGSDVALKIFSKQEYSHDLILSFRQEVSLMKRLRHPNILLFMGTAISSQRLAIATEFLPRGSLFQLLRRYRGRFNWKHRVHMAMDIAQGMNYLHHCLPPIIHYDLKSSNLLVDKTWTVKYDTNEGIRTPQWMAPEVLRNEEADEKSDVYSYGVVLWEITTEKIPWDGLNYTQVIKAVGFTNQQLDIPKDVDPQWASLIERCLCREPKSRPTFQKVLVELKELQKRFAKLRQFRSETESHI